MDRLRQDHERSQAELSRRTKAYDRLQQDHSQLRAELGREANGRLQIHHTQLPTGMDRLWQDHDQFQAALGRRTGANSRLEDQPDIRHKQLMELRYYIDNYLSSVQTLRGMLEAECLGPAKDGLPELWRQAEDYVVRLALAVELVHQVREDKEN